MLIISLLAISTISIVILAIRTAVSIRRYRSPRIDDAVVAPEPLPTVTVCIAARNETHALAQCLERVLKSDYAKLEILVLDDSSNDDTSLIIKSFAHAGVRFIAGKPLPDGWLGKNHAFQTLIDESSGDLLLFIDVDTVIKPTTVSHLVRSLSARSGTMLSVLPRRDDGYRLSAIAGTMRYYWELLLWSPSSPPASSALWMIDAREFGQDGVSFEHYAMSVRPERHLARQIHRRGTYSYLIGTPKLGVSYEKHLHSQYETAERLYYPATGRRTVWWLLTSAYLLSLLVPLVILLLTSNQMLITLWSAGLVIVTALTFGMFVRMTYGGISSLLRIAIGPLLVMQEFLLLAVSYIRYRHGSVRWKGRLVNAQPTNSDALELNS